MRMLICIVLLAAAPAGAQEPRGACEGREIKSRVGEARSSASIFANVMNREGSVRREIAELLERAHQMPAPAGGCPGECRTAPRPVTVIQSVPSKAKDDASNKAECAKNLAETSADPFRVSDKRFGSRDELYEWIQSFTQGKGDEGRALYARCADRCSPQYTFRIAQQSGGEMLLSASVICGQQRDKQDNTYMVSAENVWACTSSAGG